MSDDLDFLADAPAPEVPAEEPAPAPVVEEPAPAPVVEEPAPAPVVEEPAPAPVVEEAPLAEVDLAESAVEGSPIPPAELRDAREALPEYDVERPSLDDVRARASAALAALNAAEKALAAARVENDAAQRDLAAAESPPTLQDINQAIMALDAAESAQRASAAARLAELGFRVKPKPHPLLFKP